MKIKFSFIDLKPSDFFFLTRICDDGKHVGIACGKDGTVKEVEIFPGN
jgi:hypothetical protein